MKFLCPSCKAKYQIADEKVAGRSVRMKCRKCGFMIQVSSAMAAPSAMESEPPEMSDGDAASAAPPPAPAPAPEVGEPPPDAAPAPVPEVGESPLVASPRPAPVRPGPTASKLSAPKPAALPAPRSPPGKLAGPVPKPAAPPPRASAPKATAPVAPVAVPRAAPRPAPSPTPAAVAEAEAEPAAAAAEPAPSPAPAAATAPVVAELPRDFEGEEEVTRMADAGALAGAFTQAFGRGTEAPAAVDAPLSMPGDEWFVGINGVPVGPIRLSELRSKAASGAVSKESLVWRDGFEDWRPLKTYPELLAIVEEGVSSARASLTPFTPPAYEAREVAEKAGVAAADRFAATSPSAVTGSAVVTDDISALVLPRRGTSPMIWVAMIIAIALGLTLGFVLFGGQKPAETKYVEKIIEKEVHVKDPSGQSAANNDPGQVVAADPTAPKKGGGPGRVPTPGPSSDAKPNPGLIGLNVPRPLTPPGGPQVDGPSGTSNNGAQLDGGQIQSTVSRYTGSVKRRCWQPALDARARDAPMTAKVTVTITVGGSGSVQNVTNSGDPRGYSGLANCISSSVRSWTFPASGGTTIANVPFVFAGQ